MADGTTKSKPASAPNFYSAAGQMYSGASGASGAKPGADAAATGEKVKNVTALLEVVKKIDKMETDPANKELTQQMVTLVEQYMTKLQPTGATPAAGATTGAAEGMSPGAAAAGGAGPSTGAGAGGGGMAAMGM